VGATVRSSPWAGVLVFALFAAFAVTMIVPAVIRSRGRTGNDAQYLASRSLARALPDIPFTVRLPEELPADAKLVRVFLDKPDYQRGYQAYTLNTYYSVPGTGEKAGHSVHVWQTNDPFLARNPIGDPTTRGVPERIAGQDWSRTVDDELRDHAPITAFAVRYADGITLTVDATDPDDARAAIRALAEVNPGALTGGVDVDAYRAAVPKKAAAKSAAAK
jgi:hypothetical protein